MESLTFSRLLHSYKMMGGNFIGQFLSRSFDSGKGSVSRLHHALASSEPSTEYSSRILIQPKAVPRVKPHFFVRGFVEEQYLNKINKCGRESTISAGIISAKDVDVSFPIGSHLSHGRMFEEALLGTELLKNPKYFWDVETIPFQRKIKASEAILLSLPWHHNFFHWMIEILPRLVLYDLAPDLHHLKLLVPASSPRFVKESLELTGYEDKVSFIEDGVYRFKELHILSKLSKTATVSPFAIEWLNKKVAKGDTGKPGKRLYVSRSDAKNRYVTNESEVQRLLSDFGFETVTMSHYTLKEQIKLFEQAEIVIGSHGAAFASMAFMKPNTTLIEFFRSGHFNPCFYRMACLKNLRYGFLVGQQRGPGLSVCTAQLSSLLRQAL